MLGGLSHGEDDHRIARTAFEHVVADTAWFTVRPKSLSRLLAHFMVFEGSDRISKGRKYLHAALYTESEGPFAILMNPRSTRKSKRAYKTRLRASEKMKACEQNYLRIRDELCDIGRREVAKLTTQNSEFMEMNKWASRLLYG